MMINTYCFPDPLPPIMPPVKLIVASDEPLLCRGLSEVVREQAGWRVASEAAGAGELLDAIRSEHFDVAVITLPLGNDQGLELIAAIRAADDLLPVIVLAGYSAEHYAMSFVRAGANAFLPRNASPDQIREAIASVAGGGKYLSPAVATELARSLGVAGEPQPPHERLSRREQQVFRMLAAGATPTAIGTSLGLSVKTVSTYRARILEKTGFRSNADMVAYAIRNRLL